MPVCNGAARCASIAWLFAWIVLAPSVSVAQTPAAAPEPPPRMESSAQATFLATGGNASTQALGLGGEITWRPTAWVVLGKAAFAQTENDDELSARSTVATSRVDRFLTPRTSLYGQYGYLRDIFAGVVHRSTIAGGVAYKLIDRPAHQLSLDGAMGYEHEDRTADESKDHAIATSGVAYKWLVSATSSLTEEARFVQALSSVDNWKVDQTVTLTAAITTILSFKLGNIVRYVNEPAPGFESTDTITSVALVLTIRRPAP